MPSKPPSGLGSATAALAAADQPRQGPPRGRAPHRRRPASGRRRSLRDRSVGLTPSRRRRRSFTHRSLRPRYSPPRRLRGKLRAAHAHASARVLPKPLERVQMTERPRHGAKVIRAEALGNVGIVERLLVDGLQNLIRQGGDPPIIAGNSRGIRLAVNVILYLRAIGVGIGDALVIFARNAFRYRG